MIPKSAVNEYVNRRLDDHLWVKKLNKRSLLAALDELDPPPEIHSAAGTHQLACILLGIAFRQFCFWLDMGVGKTFIALTLLKYWWQCGLIKRAVIFITSDKAFSTWEKQIKRWKIDMPYTLLEGSSVDKWQRFHEFGEGLVFISYPGAVNLCTKTVVKKRKGKRKKNKWALDQDLVDDLLEDLGAFVLDESTRAANHGSLTFGLIEKLKAEADIRYALAGRPFGRDPTMLWSQHFLIDDGETLGPTLGMFREAFFTSKANPWVAKNRQKYIRKWTFDKRNEGALSEIIQHRSIAYSAEECIDLPKWVPIIEEVRFSEEAGAYYKRAVETIIKSKGNMREVKNIFLRMRQLSSGFVGFVDDETGERAQVEFDENPKFDRQMDLLYELPKDRKAVVFYDFTWSGRKIYTEAKEMGLRPIWLWSGTKDYKRDMYNFENKPGYDLAVVQNRVGAFSLDGLQVANYCFFYESPVSVIDREQAERRLRRQGQTRRVFQYDIIVRGSTDAKILAYHREGEALMKALLRDPSILLK